MDAEAGSSLFDRISQGLGRAAAEGSASSASEPDDSADATARGDDDAADVGGIVIGRSRTWPAPDISTQIERPRISNRQCSRPGCSDTAAVTLSYHYGQSQVWIDRLSPEREPHMYDMCDQHAERLSVPRGWHLEDRRGARRGALIAV